MSNDDDRTQAFTGKAGAKVGKYTLLNRIGAGGMGEVFLAEDASLKRMVAIKFLPAHLAADPELRARFTREAQAAAALNHPNVVHVYEVGEHEELPYFVMEHVDGPSLRDRMREEKERASELPDLLRIAQQLAEGLAEAHTRGIVHRDVKPGNVVFDRSGRPKLLDFGLAGMSGQEQLTQAGSTLGTVGYMAPEQIRGRQSDPRSDLFSLGVVLYELLAGRPPFQKDTEAATIESILHTVPEPLARYRAGLPDGVQRIVDKLLEKNPEMRYQGAADAAADLRREIRILEGDTGPVSTAHPAVTTGSGRKVWIPAAVAVLLAAALLVWRPWAGKHGGPDVAEAGVNRLAVLYFDNITDPEDSQRLGEIVSSLLITGMSEANTIQVVSTQRLYDILKQMGKEGEKRISPADASEVARRAGAKWMLTGSILQTRPQMVITSQLVEVGGGDVVASDRTNGKPGEDVFAVADRITAQLRKELNLAPAGGEPGLVSLGIATTRSPEAYAAYLEALEWERKYYAAKAESLFNRAVQLDPGFALAYHQLAIVDLRWNTAEEAIEHNRLAMQNIAGTAWRDSLSIVSLQKSLGGDDEGAMSTLQRILERDPMDKEICFRLGIINRNLGRDEKALEYWKRTIELDPSSGEAYNQLGYTLCRLGDYDGANAAIQRYIQLNPNEPNPYDSQGDIFGLQGRPEDALTAYRKAIEIAPDFTFTQFKIGAMLMFTDHLDEARETFLNLPAESQRDILMDPVMATALISCWQGRFGDALHVVDARLATYPVGDKAARQEALTGMAGILSRLGRKDEAVAAMEAGLTLAPDKPEALSAAIWLFTRAGNVDRANALLEHLEELIRTTRPDATYQLNLARADIAAARGDHLAAAQITLNGASTTLGAERLVRAGIEYMRADDPRQALPWLERAVRAYDLDRFFVTPENVLVVFELARAYDALDRTSEAADTYRKFLHIWRNADPGIPEVEQAKARLVVLGG